VGTICHLTPYLSTFQPQAYGFPPFFRRAFQ
jgi:hypothetical protein